MPLAEAAALHPELVRERLGTLVARDDAFAARNEARWRDGVLVYVPAGAPARASRCGSTVAGAAGDEIEWRALIVLGEGAEAEVWERYASRRARALFNGVVELVVGDGANLRYVCEQELSDAELGVRDPARRGRPRRQPRVGRARLRLGARQGADGDQARRPRLDAPRSPAPTPATATQHLDYDTTQEHAAEDTTSDLAFRGVLADRATAVWRGMIRVDPGAQRTDAFQESRNLLLSTDAHADAIPGLEIEADDVRCTHAAAVAQVDPEQLYYLRSHGLVRRPRRSGWSIEGFLQELVERAHEGPIREALGERLERASPSCSPSPSRRFALVRAQRGHSPRTSTSWPPTRWPSRSASRSIARSSAGSSNGVSRAAVLADRVVVVVATRHDRLVARAALAHLDPLDQPAARGAGRAPGRRSRYPTRWPPARIALGDLLGAEAAVLAREQLDHRPPRPAGPPALGAERPRASSVQR